MTYIGVWDSSVTYAIGEQVTNDGLVYQALAASTDDEPPDATKWTLLTAYLSPEDLRTPDERYPGLNLDQGSYSDAVVLSFALDASALLDRLTGDHFLPTSGVVVVDGPPVDGFGRTRSLLPLPRRVRSVSEVATVATDGTTATALDPDTYRVHSSLAEPSAGDTPVFLGAKGMDAIQFLYGPSDDSVTLPSWGWSSGTFPSYPRAVKVTGTFDWSATPEPLKHATALLVIDWARTAQVPAKAARFNSGRAQIELSLEGQTGIPEVDRVIKLYQKAPLPLVAV